MTDPTGLPANPLFCALDTGDRARARVLGLALRPHVGGLKLGLEFFMANGPGGVAEIAALETPLFLDLKLHDIPNTVAGALRSLAPLGAHLVTLHGQGGKAMLQAAVDGAREGAERAGTEPPRLIGVTVLTSLDDGDLAAMGVQGGSADQVARLADLAYDAGLDGIVCSPHELSFVRARFPAPFTLVVPGLRPQGEAAGDQKRVMTPEDASSAGADILVVGRPITEAPSPAEAAERIAHGVMRARGARQ